MKSRSKIDTIVLVKKKIVFNYSSNNTKRIIIQNQRVPSVLITISCYGQVFRSKSKIQMFFFFKKQLVDNFFVKPYKIMPSFDILSVIEKKRIMRPYRVPVMSKTDKVCIDSICIPPTNTTFHISNYKI